MRSFVALFVALLLLHEINSTGADAILDTSRECPVNVRSKCVNGGWCQVYLEGGREMYRCKCPFGYEGRRCETNIDRCRFNKCANGAKCVDNLEGYTCSCAQGFKGPHCTERIAVEIKRVQVGPIVLILLTDGQTFADNVGMFLRTVREMLNVSVTIKHDSNDQPMVYQWSSDRGFDGERRVPIDSEVDVARRARSPNGTVYTGVLVVLTVDTSDCASENECFDDVLHVAGFLAAAPMRKRLSRALGWPVYSVRTGEQCKESDCPPLAENLNNYLGVIIGGAIAAFLILMLIAGFIVSRKRTVQAKLWKPPGYDEARAEVLDKQKADVRECPEWGLPPPAKCARIALTSRGRLSTIDENDEYDNKSTLLFAAARDGNVEGLRKALEAGTSLEVRTPARGETPLHLACRHSQVKTVAYLLGHGADPNAQDSDGNTPLHKAVADNCAECVELLLIRPSCRLDVPNSEGLTPLLLACRLAHADLGVLHVLLRNAERTVLIKADSVGRTPLHWAAKNDRADMAHELLIRGAAKNARDECDETPLFVAAGDGALQAVHILLKHGATADMRDHLGRLPRDIASEHGHCTIVDMLDAHCHPEYKHLLIDSGFLSSES